MNDQELINLDKKSKELESECIAKCQSFPFPECTDYQQAFERHFNAFNQTLKEMQEDIPNFKMCNDDTVW
jgi:hypothetical protein